MKIGYGLHEILLWFCFQEILCYRVPEELIMCLASKFELPSREKSAIGYRYEHK